MNELKVLSYDLRKHVVDMIIAGKGGHIGGDMSVMEILVELYMKQMNISPENKDLDNRDRFVLSKGHSVESYYAVLAKKGFFPMEEVISTFSQFGSKFIGHPNNKLPGIEMNSGSLGHSLPVCVGMAMERWTGRTTVSMWSWGTGSWQRALCGKAPWQPAITAWITCAPWWTGTGCRFPGVRRMSWATMTCMSVSEALDGM